MEGNGVTIPDFDMHPIEFRLLQVGYRGLRWSPSALNAQYMELTDPAAWLLHRGHAHRLGVYLAEYKLLRD